MLERYYQELLGFFGRALRDRDSASDVVHESYARVLAMQLRTSLLAEPRALLYRIGKNLIVDQARRHQVERRVLEALAATACDEAPSTDRVVAARQDVERLLARLAVMPPKRREVFVMVRVYGHSHAEVAERLNLSVAAIEKHVVRGVLDCASIKTRACRHD